MNTHTHIKPTGTQITTVSLSQILPSHSLAVAERRTVSLAGGCMVSLVQLRSMVHSASTMFSIRYYLFCTFVLCTCIGFFCWCFSKWNKFLRNKEWIKTQSGQSILYAKKQIEVIQKCEGGPRRTYTWFGDSTFIFIIIVHCGFATRSGHGHSRSAVTSAHQPSSTITAT